jgi:hypothetical protein
VGGKKKYTPENKGILSPCSNKNSALMSFLLDLLYNTIVSPLSKVIELPLDPRWDFFTDENEFIFHHHRQQHQHWYDETMDQQRASAAINTPSVSVSDMISNIQLVHDNIFQLDTTSSASFSENIIDDDTAGGGGGGDDGNRKRRGSMLAKSSLLLQNRNKSRRIRKIRHELEMNRKRHEYNKKLLDYVLYSLDSRHKMQPDPFITQLLTKSDENMDENIPKKPVPIFHIIRDFDEIQQLYDECVLDALNIEHAMKLLYRRRQSDIDAENETLTRLVKAYLYGPVLKDEFYRHINNSIFHTFDDDPMQLLLKEKDREKLEFENDDSHITVNSIYPKLRTLSKRSEKERLERRQLLLSTVKSESDKIDDAKAWDIEVERISALLAEVL